MDSELITLDRLLGDGEPYAMFHDAKLLSLEIDYTKKSLTAEFRVCVGNPDAADPIAQERRRRGRIGVEGLRLFAMEPPDERPTTQVDFPWLTDDGLLRDCPTETAKWLVQSISRGEVAWYLYFSDLNAFAYIVGRRASFEWV